MNTSKFTKHQRPDALQIWEQIEEHVVPRLRLCPADRSVYAYLLRHSRLQGRAKLRFSILGLARQIQLSGKPVRDAVRRLAGFGVLRLIERSREGHLAEVRLPEEIRAARNARQEGAGRITAGETGMLGAEKRSAGQLSASGFESTDFLRSFKLRQAIHERERGVCFYCLRKIRARLHCLDHVVPQAKGGGNSYRNLVSCCLECNASKGERSADDFLRGLYRDGRLTPAELKNRLAALKALAAGKLCPRLP